MSAFTPVFEKLGTARGTVSALQAYLPKDQPDTFSANCVNEVAADLEAVSDDLLSAILDTQMEKLQELNAERKRRVDAIASCDKNEALQRVWSAVNTMIELSSKNDGFWPARGFIERAALHTVLAIVRREMAR